MEDGITSPATELDHKIKHNGDPVLFWDQDNWQGLCNSHHRGYKARLERSGKDTACDVNGYPVAVNKYW